jgi:hypothetical protein
MLRKKITKNIVCQFIRKEAINRRISDAFTFCANCNRNLIDLVVAFDDENPSQTLIDYNTVCTIDGGNTYYCRGCCLKGNCKIKQNEPLPMQRTCYPTLNYNTITKKFEDID